MEKTLSIHPRVVGGRTKYEKVNTSKPKNISTIEKAMRGIERHLERHPNDRFSQEHLNNLKGKL